MGALGDEVLGDRETEALGGTGDERDPAFNTTGKTVPGMDLPPVGLSLPVLDEPPRAVREVPDTAQARCSLADTEGVEVDVARGVGLGPGVPCR